MRISTAYAFDQSVKLLNDKQSQMYESALQMTSGKAVTKASDDPTNAARVERALAAEQRADVNQRALESARTVNTLAEQALGDAGGLIQDARDLLVQAGNTSMNAADRQSITQALQGIRAQMLATANRKDPNGTPLFGGQGSNDQAFVDTPTGVQWTGTAGRTQVASGEHLENSVDGRAAFFLQQRSGNGVFVTSSATPASMSNAWIDAGSVTDASAVTGDPYTIAFSTASGATTWQISRNGTPVGTPQPYVSGQSIGTDGWQAVVQGAPADGETFAITPAQRDQSIFEVLDTAIHALNDPAATTAAVSQAVSNGLRDLDSSHTRVLTERARLGEVLDRTDAIEGRIADAKLAARTTRSNAEDVDMIEAVSEFQKRQTSYDAALKAYSTVQKLSLFDYLG